MSSENLFALLIPACSVVVIGGAVAIVIAMIVRRRRQLSDLASQIDPFAAPLPLAGVRIPIGAAYGGRKSLGPIALSNNNLNPLLILHDDRVEYRILFKRSRSYAEIEEVDTYFADRHLKLFFSGGATFSAFLPNRKVMADLLAFLQRKGLTLSESAGQMIESQGSNQPDAKI